jgi:glutamate carboxypeptidase
MSIPLLTRACDTFWPETKAFLREMVEINSFTTNVPGVNRVGECVAARFAAMGFEAAYVPHGSVAYGSHLVLKRPPVAGGATVALIAHLDTVFSTEEETRNAFHWREEGTRIHGPGTNDIKGGIAMIYLVLSALRAHAPELYHSTNWVILCNSCEEVDSEDFGGVCRAHLPSDAKACLIFEADGGDGEKFSLVTSRKGRATFQLDVCGRGAHAGSRHSRGANAIVQIGRVIEKLESRTNYEKGLTINVGTITGGVVMNRVPEVATAQFEMRSTTVEAFEEEKRFILSQTGPGDLHSRESQEHRCQIRVSQLDETSPWPPNEASDRLFAYWEEAGREMSRTVIAQSRGGLSDGNVLWNYFPTIDGLGPEGDHAHCSEHDPAEAKVQEYVETKSFVSKAVLNITALGKLLGAPGIDRSVI